MPWKEKTVEENRTGFVAEALVKEKSISQLCREYNITRKTGYKWLDRAKNNEPMDDKTRGTGNHPMKTSSEKEAVILNARADHPAWGARKLKRHLENQGHTGLPAQSTICEILKRNGMVLPEESAARVPYKRFEKSHPNEMWQMDFKGDFEMLNARRCYPLTVLDDHSRFSICLEAKENQQGKNVFESIHKLFKEYGLPNGILCDNGPPWGSSQPGGMTHFDVWMMQLDILPIHCRPLHPQTQGKDERFHRTLKDEVLKREQFEDIASAQRSFDKWRQIYNYERPHNAIDLDTPANRYRISKKSMPPVLKEPEYDIGKDLRKVNYKGYISILSRRYYLSEALIGKVLELKSVSETEIGLFYGEYRVAKIDINEQIFTSRRVYRCGAET